jgi:SAM-dependent MidA family methyltransferase
LDLLEILKANVDEKSYQKELQKVKILLQPNQLAERFKCLSIRK